jgi:hypothetical protein
MNRAAWSILSLGVAIGLSGCGGCTDPAVQDDDSSEKCAVFGEMRNPITGLCMQVDTGARDLGGSGGVDMDLDMTQLDQGDIGPVEDMGPEMRPLPDMDVIMVDVGTSDMCKPGLDSDGDGLDNACECMLGTEQGNSDTDGDGLPDGYEDANGNCRTDGLETQATRADTDSDGVSDGDEVRNGLDPLSRDTDTDGIDDGIEFMSCLDPTKADTDGDGIDDGVEDANKDGKIGICPDRMYAASCAQGEYDPCKADTDGDGEPDGEEVNFLGCRADFLAAIPSPQLIQDQASDFQLALDAQAQFAGVTGTSAYAFNHEQADYAGFVTPLAVGVSTVEQMRDLVLTRVRQQYPGASFVNTGRRTQTHEGFDAMVSIKIDLGSSGQANQARDFALSGLLTQPSVSHGLGGSFPASVGNVALLVGVVQQSNNTFLVTGAAVSDAVYQNPGLSTGFLVNDVTSAGSTASFSEALEDACVAYRVDDRPAADFIWILDGSGSMSDENESVKNYADNFVQILAASNLDWRLGTVSSNCAAIASDNAVPADVRALFGSGDCPAPPNIPIPGFSPYRYKNGMLCNEGGALFTRDPQKFKACIDEMGSPGGAAILSEHTVTMAPAAVGRALPRSDSDPSKLRPNAATIIISVTDEFDDLIQSKMGWRDAGGANEPPSDPTGMIDEMKLDNTVQPFVDYLQQPDSAATVFGIFWVPGQQCSGASEAAAGIERIVNKTGGTAGNICAGNLQTTLASIAQASSGLASGLRVEGIPVATTMGVRIGDVSTQMIEEPARSRQDGWDYDAVTNAVSFFGAQPPQTSDRVVITYKRWENSLQICTSNAECFSGGFQKKQCVNGTCR